MSPRSTNRACSFDSCMEAQKNIHPVEANRYHGSVSVPRESLIICTTWAHLFPKSSNNSSLDPRIRIVSSNLQVGCSGRNNDLLSWRNPILGEYQSFKNVASTWYKLKKHSTQAEKFPKIRERRDGHVHANDVFYSRLKELPNNLTHSFAIITCLHLTFLPFGAEVIASGLRNNAWSAFTASTNPYIILADSIGTVHLLDCRQEGEANSPQCPTQAGVLISLPG
jgi:hypothetical protein